MNRFLFFLIAASVLCSSCHKNTEKIAQDIQKVNAQCPIEIAQDMRIDSVVFNAKAKEVRYYCTLYGLYDDPEIRQAILQSMSSINKKDIQPMVAGIFSENVHDLDRYVDAKISISYIYQFSNGDEISNVKFSPDEYSAPISKEDAAITSLLTIRQNAERDNKQCPISMGEGITLMSIEFIDDTRTLAYIYKMDTDIDSTEFTDEIATAMKDNIKQSIANDITLEPHRKCGVSMNYVYKNSRDEELVNIVFGPGEY